jgi:hypothetical protein
MILQEIKRYLQNHPYASLDELTFNTKHDREVVEHAIWHWIKKKKVTTIKQHQCGRCGANCIYNDSLYTWIT